ncbi:Methylamine utilisation protein MauE [Raineyella antarctica]|uniref:Methylamine utilisation protein MauE n=1 Tax=Raineyella antarctica TaxID=1577474 RepID=A0A1G6H426_9ACTN|nr:MauE/DoxX family redox-associated membrane protein [Raineyella antarctica]SDB88176.1 Methylamine utilisation protein MauE [Raineyella antarctica]
MTAAPTSGDVRTEPTSPDVRRRRVLGWTGLACRIVLGVVLIVAGALKVANLEQSVLAVRGYQMLPYELAVAVGYVLPPLEIIVGLLLVAGLFTRWAGLIGALLMAAFVIGISQAWIRGLTIDCGCFGGGGQVAQNETKYGLELLRDFTLMATGVFLTIFPRTPFALEDRLFALRPIQLDDRDDVADPTD